MSDPLQFPAFRPEIFQIGPFALRWYALAYIVGLLVAWRVVRCLVQRPPAVATPLQVDDFLTWATLGVVLGGRLGYTMFYQPGYFLSHPLEIFAVWQGGMSFHGGFLGMVIATLVFCYRNGISPLGFADRVAVAAPIGLLLGRIANFINGELWGRPAPDWLPWRMIFPGSNDGIPRHPSQLYQAGLEGVLLLAIMLVLGSSARIRAKFGFLTGSFLVGYGIARIIGEFFRQPDEFLGFLYAGATMGQLLSLPMVIVGLVLIVRARPIPAAA
jgi:phosphatidylglycerol:prolipoprotein diacylglycerol transferase